MRHRSRRSPASRRALWQRASTASRHCCRVSSSREMAMDDLKTVWKTQPVEENTMITLSDIRTRACRFQARIRWRNVALYAYSLVNIGLSVWLIASGRLSAFKYPMLLMVAAHLLVLWQINRRMAARPLPGDMAEQPVLDFHRHELERQADGLSRAWLWYIAPFMPP